MIWDIFEYLLIAITIDCTNMIAECSVTCGGGSHQCERTCENGIFGDIGCATEDQIKLETCNEHACRKY